MENLAIGAPADFSLIALFLRAGLTVKIVMVLLVLASVWSWALIIQKLCGHREPLRVMTLEGQLEGLLGQAMRADTQRRHVIEPDLGRRIVDALQRAAAPLVADAKPFALVVQPAIRVAIRKLVRTCLPDTPVLSFFEVPEEKQVEVVAVIGAPGALPA